MSYDTIDSVLNKYKGKARLSYKNGLCFYFNSKELGSLKSKVIGDLGIMNNAHIDVVDTGGVKGAI